MVRLVQHEPYSRKTGRPPSRGSPTTMPNIDRTADVKVSAGREPVTAEIPLAGHAKRALAGALSPAGEEFRARRLGGQRSGRPHVGHRHAAFRRSGPESGSGVGAGCRKCFDRRGQRHGAEVAVSRRANRSCCPRLVGASATVAAIPPLALTCCLKGSGFRSGSVCVSAGEPLYQAVRE